MIIVNRIIDEKRMRKLKLPILVYGRRKTGKTFFVKEFFKNYNYFFVRSDRSIYFENKNEVINYNTLLHLIENSKKLNIIDEFHRMPEMFLDWVHMKAPRNLVLVTSTLNLAKKLMQKRSPILGLFMEYRMNIIDERDILNTLKAKIKNPKGLVEYAVYMREPTMLRWYGAKLERVLENTKLFVPGLLGEIFTEEEKVLSERYEAIIRAIASGKNSLSEIAATLASFGVIKSSDISAVKPYIKALIDIGVLKRVPEYMKRKNLYFISSPMVDMYYYLDEKYNFSEAEIPIECFREKVPHHVEAFFRNLLSKMFEMRAFLINKPDLEIDIALAKFKDLKIVAEVKWKNKLKKREIRALEEKLNKFEKCKRILIVPNKDIIAEELEGIEIWDVSKILQNLYKPAKELLKA